MSLQRVLEPEVMDTVEEATDYDKMDHAAVNQVFVADFLKTGFQTGNVLDLGTGTALIPIELAQRHATCRITGVDAAEEMLKLARINVENAGLASRVSLEKVDAKGLSYNDESFDAIISNSIIHHIPEPIECLREAVRVTRRQGTLFFRDLLRPSDQAELDQWVQAYAGDEGAHAQQLFAESLHAALSLAELRALVESLGFDGETVQKTTDRHWSWQAVRS